jgi:hypothetical protein
MQAGSLRYGFWDRLLGMDAPIKADAAGVEYGNPQ